MHHARASGIAHLHISVLKMKSPSGTRALGAHEQISMHCIYCREPSDDALGVAHVFPEAIAQNDITLPKGTVCDS